MGERTGAWPSALLLLLAGIACAHGADHRESGRERGSPLRPVGDLESYRGQRPVLLVSRLGGESDRAELFAFVVFEDGLVLWEGDGCRSPALERRHLSAKRMSGLQGFLSGLTSLSPDAVRMDCAHAPATEISWVLDGNKRTLEDTCDGRFGTQVKDTVAKLRNLLELEKLPPGRCQRSGKVVEVGIIWQLIRRD